MSDGGLRQIYSQQMPHAFWMPVETGSTVLGAPDSHYMFKGGLSGWIENKKVDSGTKVKMRPMQVGWLERYARYGGRCFIGVRRLNEFFLFHGSDARAVDQLGLRAGYLIMCSGGPAKWNWKKIEELLKR